MAHNVGHRFAEGKIDLDHFSYTNFWVLDPSPSLS